MNAQEILLEIFNTPPKEFSILPVKTKDGTATLVAGKTFDANGQVLFLPLFLVLVPGLTQALVETPPGAEPVFGGDSGKRTIN